MDKRYVIGAAGLVAVGLVVLAGAIYFKPQPTLQGFMGNDFPIPNLLRARQAGNEASTISSLRTITTANEQYRTRYKSYADGLIDLETAGYINESLGSSVKSGYKFTYSKTGESWSCTASPIVDGTTGSRHFYVDGSGVIRYNEKSSADVKSEPID